MYLWLINNFLGAPPKKKKFNSGSATVVYSPQVNDTITGK